MREEGQLASREAVPQQEKRQLTGRLQELTLQLRAVAEQCQGDSQCLLSLLRALESLHREIRTELFEPSLPDTRNALYQLVRDIEESGGWPYIERMKLQALLQHLLPEEEENDE